MGSSNTSINKFEFDKKVNYFIIISSLSAKSPIAKLTKKEVIAYDNEDNAKGPPLPGLKFDLKSIRIDLMENPEIAKNYSCKGVLSLGVDDCVKFEESQIKNGLKDFFNSEDCDASILFLSGHGNKNTFLFGNKSRR